MSSFIATALSTSSISTEHVGKQFEFMQHLSKFNKSFETVEEYAHRFENFLKTDAYIEEANLLAGDHPDAVIAGHNQFSTWTQEEYEALLTVPAPEMPESETISFSAPYAGAPVLGNTNWIDNGCVSPVRNQGSCGSCWSFAATDNIESSYCIANGSLPTLSQQQLVDCVTSSNGCDGGHTYYAFNYVGSYGQATAASYPYRGNDGVCSYSSSMGSVGLNTPWNTYVCGFFGGACSSNEVYAALDVRPVTVYVNASGFRFQTYTTGVLSNCTNTSINHAVTAVGYNSTSNPPYLIVKNSWDTTWGDGGYIKIDASDSINGGKGACGVLQNVYQPGAGKNW